MASDFRDDIRAYDALPAEARRLIAHSPFPLDADRVLAFWERYGTDATIATIGQLEAALRASRFYDTVALCSA
jgi:hypothetical protein